MAIKQKWAARSRPFLRWQFTDIRLHLDGD
jgi:hypothetical protein